MKQMAKFIFFGWTLCHYSCWDGVALRGKNKEKILAGYSRPLLNNSSVFLQNKAPKFYSSGYGGDYLRFLNLQN